LPSHVEKIEECVKGDQQNQQQPSPRCGLESNENDILEMVTMANSKPKMEESSMLIVQLSAIQW
jgi:hypothetical protein